MSTLHAPRHSASFGAGTGPLTRLADETLTLLKALARPGRVLREVDEMRALLARAYALDATDPARATALRRDAGRIGLR